MNTTIVISGPSGAGKGEVLRLSKKNNDSFVVPVSHTTRPPRPNEQDGIEYHFVPKQVFRDMIERNEFIEYQEVYRGGHFYGTSARVLSEARRSSSLVVLEIDVNGSRSMKAVDPHIYTIFLAPPSLEELEIRIRKRNQDNEAEIKNRLEIAKDELARIVEFDYVIVNHDLKDAVQQFLGILSRLKIFNRSTPK